MAPASLSKRKKDAVPGGFKKIIGLPVYYSNPKLIETIAMNPNQLIQDLFEKVWNQSQVEYMDIAVHEDVVVYGLDPSGTANGIENFKTFYQNFRLSFPITQIDIETLISDSESATSYCKVTAKSETGTVVSFNGISVNRFKNDKLTESWNCFDFLRMYQQLGHILQSSIGSWNPEK